MQLSIRCRLKNTAIQFSVDFVDLLVLAGLSSMTVLTVFARGFHAQFLVYALARALSTLARALSTRDRDLYPVRAIHAAHATPQRNTHRVLNKYPQTKIKMYAIH